MDGFKKFGGEDIADLGTYVREYLHRYPDVEVLIGCDSDQYRKNTVYAVAVCLYHPRKGAHVIFKTEHAIDPTTGRPARNRSEGERLWGEIERVKVIADYLDGALDTFVTRMTGDELRKLGLEPIQTRLVEIHVDFNPEPHTAVQASKRRRKKRPSRRATDNKSNQLHATAVSYLVGLGYRVKTKPLAWAASTAADLIVRKKRKRVRF